MRLRISISWKHCVLNQSILLPISTQYCAMILTSSGNECALGWYIYETWELEMVNLVLQAKEGLE